ncbi:hypothetical protein [Brevundimonas sp.]|uniref:hypothetical protein n=1 Tax=Brevundimonas sp. TaxID=1871086 RepID=UPI002CDEEE86|nr:hypothetical protein [Brevundimonas sp.]HWQ87192.1 hypothetical protein [Brevundimonas sp.]
MNHLYLARASTLALLDAEARRRISDVPGAGDYLKKAGPAPATVPARIRLKDGQSIRLGAAINWTEDMDKIDWSTVAAGTGDNDPA